MNRTALLLARALLALPDLHRVDPWWRALCEARRVALRRSGVRVGDGVVVHERVHLDRTIWHVRTWIPRYCEAAIILRPRPAHQFPPQLPAESTEPR